MDHFKIVVPLFLGLALAGDISLQPFVGSDCLGNSLTNIHASAANPDGSSNCIATGQYGAVQVICADPGFQCNLYTDPACNRNNFLMSVDTPGCFNAIGMGVVCFNQALTSNPLADSTATLTIGKTNIVALTGGDTSSFVKNAVEQACSSSGCDPTTQAITSFQRNTDCTDVAVAPGASISCITQEQCSQSVSISGNFDSTDERDYMSALLQAALATTTAANVTNPGADSLVTILSFAQVVINDQNNDNQAEMAITISVQCSNVAPGNVVCDDGLKLVVSTALEAVPEVGSFLAGLFDIACQ